MTPNNFAQTYRGKKVLVTGHTGFKGSWLCEWLLQLGADVTGFSIDLPSTPSLFEAIALPKRMKDVRGDICDLPALQKVFKDTQPEIVFHLAAQPIVRASYDNPKLTFDTNVGGTVNVFEAIRQTTSVKAAVVITTDKCYENNGSGQSYKETDPLGGHDPYSASKAGTEIVFGSYSRSFFHAPNTARVASARAGNVIGGGDWAADRIIADCVRSWSRGEKVKIRTPLSIRPWQHVLEPIAAYLLLGERLLTNPQGVHGESFNIGPDDQLTKRTIELVEALEKFWPGTGHEITQVNDGKKEALTLRLDCAKAKEVLHWHPALGFAETAEWVASWYKSYYSKPEAALQETQNQIQEYQKLFSSGK